MINLPFQVEEKLAHFDDQPGFDLVKYGEVLILHLQMLAQVKSVSIVSNQGFCDA